LTQNSHQLQKFNFAKWITFADSVAKAHQLALLHCHAPLRPKGLAAEGTRLTVAVVGHGSVAVVLRT
jgi:hypothetical protein